MQKPNKIRVLQGIRQGKIGGGESYLLGLVEHMNKDNFQPVVLSFTDGPMIDRLKANKIPVHVIHTQNPFDITIWGKVSRLMKSESINLVHAHGTRAMSNMFWAAQRNKLPLAYTCHGWSFHQDQPFLVKQFRIKSEKYLTSKADLNICVSKANRSEGKKLFGSFEAEVVYNSIDPEKFNPYETYPDIRSELGLHPADFIYTSIARFTHQKQPLELIKAFADLCSHVPKAKLLMVGDGEQKSEAITLVEKLGLRERVLLLPFRSDVPAVLAACDVFVLPSLWEGFPIALFEAMSMGKAVIATNIDGTPEMVTHNYNGILIETTNLRQNLSQSMISLWKNSELKIRLEKNAIASIYNKYKASDLAKANEILYRKLLANH